MAFSDPRNWKDRIEKEERAAQLFMTKQLGFKTGTKVDDHPVDAWDNDWTSPLHGLHRAFAVPIHLPSIDGDASRVSTACKNRALRSSHSSAMLLDLAEDNERLGSAAASRRSRRSLGSSRSMASLNERVGKSVEKEVARVSSATLFPGTLPGMTRRERLTQMLERAKGSSGQ
eukprot:TRINITY_DN69085_c0_g1_i1.p1 TRINITY_DN69085_c0_g1~~TRINITY_DN69085_c0_g1_i1.p1  ORF type:complete len:188 (+),score=28.39 TRINITY_DN69085_c0_g1_i1:46-564(+)